MATNDWISEDLKKMKYKISEVSNCLRDLDDRISEEVKLTEHRVGQALELRTAEIQARCTLA